MQIVEVQDNREKPDSYCPICGIKNVGFSDKFVKPLTSK